MHVCFHIWSITKFSSFVTIMENARIVDSLCFDWLAFVLFYNTIWQIFQIKFNWFTEHSWGGKLRKETIKTFENNTFSHFICIYVFQHFILFLIIMIVCIWRIHSSRNKRKDKAVRMRMALVILKQCSNREKVSERPNVSCMHFSIFSFLLPIPPHICMKAKKEPEKLTKRKWNACMIHANRFNY